MDVMNIIGKGFKYPFKNVKFSILFLVTSFILGIFNYLVNNNLLNETDNLILWTILIVTAIIYLFQLGLSVTITGNAIRNLDYDTNLDLKDIFSKSIGMLVVGIVYTIIICAVLVLFFPSFLVSGDLSSANPISLIVMIAIIILFALFSLISLATYADTGSIKDALNFPEMYNIIRKITWSKYITYIILMVLSLFLIGLLIGVLSIIPSIGDVLELIVSAYVEIMVAYTIGLLYRDVYEEKISYNPTYQQRYPPEKPELEYLEKREENKNEINDYIQKEK